MSAVMESVGFAPAAKPHEAMLQAVRALADGPLAELADDIDRRGIYPKGILQRLGELGAFKAHMKMGGDAADFGAAIQAITEVSRVCGATGFMVWCHDVCGVYMEQSGNPALAGSALANHVAGHTLGATGMSNPMKTFAGIETLLLKAREVEGGFIVNGALPWVSNLGPDHYFGAVAVVEGDGTPREVMFIVHCDGQGVELRNCPSFSAMEGTNTFAVRMTDHFVSADKLIADPVRPFIGRIRAAFILLQVGMGLGVAQGAIDSMWQVERQLGHVNEFLEDRPDELQAELDALTERTMRLAQTPYANHKEFLIDVLDTRAHASELSLRAAQSALLHQGARGYLMSSAVQRRVRESHFVAIVTPAIKHLRKEIARLSAAEMPT
ncbi:MAG: acyl-CoA dehydrogenase family protein [Burkholderiales bacterium]|nr:acyl-CoA dehydrogenase family protein [Burkholderiales bacterium]